MAGKSYELKIEMPIPKIFFFFNGERYLPLQS